MTEVTPEQPEKKVNPAEVLAELKKTNASLLGVTEQLVTVENRTNKTRNIVYALTVGIVVVAGAWAFDRVNSRVDDAVKYDVASCVSSNSTRTDALMMWNTQADAVASLSKSQSTQKFAVNMRAQAAKTYAQRDCSAIKKGLPAPVITPAPPAPTATPVK